MSDNPIWAEKYRPHRVADCVLPSDLKATFQAMVDKKEVPGLLLVGPPGIGKTTVAMAVLDELEADYLVINASLEGNIDTLRTKILDFASSVSFSGGRKYVLLDEADHLNPQSTQPALRNFMEQYSRNCGFILTANFGNKIIEPLQSRCPPVEFRVQKSDRPVLAAEFFQRVQTVLKVEGVTFDEGAVAQVVTKYFPDWRRVLNVLQRHSATGHIGASILKRHSDESLKQLVDDMRQKNFTAVRKWVAENGSDEPSVLFRRIYETMADHFATESIPQLVMLLAEYQDKAARVADQEINTSAFLVHVMSTCLFRE